MPRLPSMGTALAHKERMWADRSLYLPGTLAELLTLTELLGPAAAGGTLFLQGSWSPHLGIPGQKVKRGVRRQ